MNMRTKELKTYNLPSDNALISEINAKPTWVFILFIIIGILSIALRFSYLYGGFIIATGLICVIFMPRVTVMEFYHDYLVAYNRVDKSKCFIIYYNEVSSWYYSWSAKKDYLCIELEDGSEEKIEAFSKTLFEAYMYKFLKDKHKKNK